MPVSTTHVISTAIMGVGTSDRIKAVRWGIARSIITAWILTIPSTAIIAGVSYLLLHLVGA
jgi:PiT family inorganic phosphate transporter